VNKLKTPISVDTSADVAQREQAEAVLQTTHHELETKVRERTSELAAAIADLQREAAERKLVEAALRNSELRQRQIVDCASDTIYRISPKGRFTFVNSSAAALVNRSVEECVGLHFLSLVREDFRNQAALFYRQQIAEKIPVTYFEFPAVTKDSGEVWIGQNVQLVIENGQVVELQGIARDITSRKEIEERLLESEHRYRLLFERNPLPVWVYDLETLAFLAVNDAAISHYGYSRAEFLAMTIGDIRPREDIPALHHTVAKLIGDLDNTGKWRHRKKDKSIIDVEITSHPLEFAGRPARIVLAFDITEQKRSDQALRESEEKYRTILENIEDGYYEVDIAGNLTFFNDAMCKILSYSRAELMGMNNREYCDQENSRKLYETFNRVHRTGESAHGFDWQVIRKDGGVRHVEASVSLIKDPSGRSAGFRGIVHDITERKRAEKAMSDLRRELELTMNSMEEGVHRVDLQGNIVFENPAAARMLGWEVAELLGKRGHLTMHHTRPDGTPYPKEECPIYATFRDGISRRVSDELFWRQDGTSFPVEYSTAPVRNDRNEIVAAVVTFRDITERKRTEEELEESRQWLAAVYDSSRDGIIVEESERIVYVNESYAHLFGYEPNELMGQPVQLVSEQEPSERMLEYRRRRLHGEEAPSLYEFSGTRKDGTTVDLEASVSTAKIAARAYVISLCRDITERKRAESEILLQKARFQQLFENAPMGILRVDQNDIVLDANKEFEDIFQFSLDEMRGRPINEIIVPKTHREEGTKLSSRSLEGEIIGQESVRQRKDGTLIPVHIYGVPIVVNQKPVGVFAIYVDLSERKRLEEERQAVFEIIQGAISTSDLGDLFKLIHKSISGLLYAENCFVALHDPNTDLMHFEFWVDKLDPCPQPLPQGIGFTNYVMRTGRPLLLTEELKNEMYERGVVQKSGSSSASWLGVPLRTQSRTIGVLVVQHYEDEHSYTQSDLEFLTSVGSQIALAIERKQAEQALQEANKRALTEYERLMERIAALGRTLGSARDLTMVFRALRDFAGASVPCDGLAVSLYEPEKRTRRVVYCWTDNEELNLEDTVEVPVGSGITGRAIKSGTVIIDNNFKARVGAEGKPVLLGERVDERLSRSALIVPMTVMGRTVGCVEVQAHHLNAYVQEHATAMRMAANLAANAVENVSLIEREQAQEEQLRQSQKMESIGTLAGGIAHDFNNLMTAVTGYSELALRSLSSEDSLRPKLEVIKSAGERAASLTRQLLAFSRKQMLQPRMIDLNTVVTGMAEMLPRVIGEHIDLQFKLGDSPGQIKADPGQVEQVLMNLAVNARDAMPEGGVLTIRTENVHLTEKFGHSDLTIEPGHYVLMAVSDSGSGMDAETQSHIFEPFFTTKGVGKGTGLGLSTVYGIVKQSGGSLWVYSKVGEGTTFKIYFPSAEEIVDSNEIEVESAAVPRGQETVLLVEDEDVVRNLSKEILETYGYSVLVAANGREGLAVGKEFQGQIDLVITDVIMPQMGGREMAEGLKTIRPNAPVLFMSGFTDDAIVHHGVFDETVFFIQKPFSPEALASKAREVLDHVAST